MHRKGERTGQKPRVLLMMPDQVLAKAYRARLMKERFEVEWHRTGPDGLAAAEGWRPDIILLDVVLHGMDALEVLKRLRDMPFLVQVEVMLLVERAVNRELLDDYLLWSGGDAFEKDTSSPDALVAHVRRVLQRPRAHATHTNFASRNVSPRTYP
jgi:DNA-binding response OmpR family regulator